MSETIHIKLPDGSDKEMPKGTTALQIAKEVCRAKEMRQDQE